MLVKIDTPNSTGSSSEHIDPVCGMTVDPLHAAGSHEYRGKTYFFCNPSCLERFKNNPTAYLEPKKTDVSSVVHKDVEYTCPMDPEVRQIGPGACPKCGMALEPVNI